jgi:hypothetical protein
MAGCVAALAIVGGAPAAEIGANDDTGKYAADGGGVYFAQMAALGLKQSVMTTRFVPSAPATIQDQDALDRAIPLAQLAGLHVSLAVYPYPPRGHRRAVVSSQARHRCNRPGVGGQSPAGDSFRRGR